VPDAAAPLSTAERLAIATTVVGILHHADHVLRYDHSGWPLRSDVTPFRYSLLVYVLIAAIFLLREHRRTRAALAFVLFVFPTAAHVILETPLNQYDTWVHKPDVNLLHASSAALGATAVAITLLLSALALATFVAFFREASKPPAVQRAYRPGTRSFGSFPPHLQAALEAVVPSRDRDIEYRPCRVTLRDGSVHSCVYVVDAQRYIAYWGVWPDDDPAKSHVAVRDVVALAESPFRLPPRFADEIYRRGESAMGYTSFVLRFTDGTEQAYAGGNAIDFVPLPAGKTMADVAAVLPHHDRKGATLRVLHHEWCLFGDA
jgi:hypothetical protein